VYDSGLSPAVILLLSPLLMPSSVQ